MSIRDVVAPALRHAGGKAQFFSTIIKNILECGRKFINLLACKYLWEILIPEKPNKSTQPFSQDHHDPLFAMLRKVSGGSTRCPVAYGEWVHEGEVLGENMIPVRFTSSREDARGIAKWAREHYDQDLIWAYPLAKVRNLILAPRQETTTLEAQPNQKLALVATQSAKDTEAYGGK